MTKTEAKRLDFCSENISAKLIRSVKIILNYRLKPIILIIKKYYTLYIFCDKTLGRNFSLPN